MIVGFTGTRNGMTVAQKETVRRLLAELRPCEVDHGDCVGADADFHAIVRASSPQCRIVISPGPDSSMRAFCDGDHVMPPKSHFARNRDIVMACRVLIATPWQTQSAWQTQLLNTGGTWYTINYAKKVGREVRIVWSDGSIDQ